MMMLGHDWEYSFLSIPTVQTIRQIRQHFFAVPSQNDVYLAYSGMPALRFSGFLVCEAGDINRLLAFCPIQAGLELASALWCRDVRRHLTTAAQLAASGGRMDGNEEAIQFKKDGEGNLVIPSWVFGLTCVPLTSDSDGTLLHPRPFSAEFFQSMAQQPEAKKWLIRQHVKVQTVSTRVPMKSSEARSTRDKSRS